MLFIRFVFLNIILITYVQHYDLEELTVDLQLLEMDLLDKCEDIANTKHSINLLINTNQYSTNYYLNKTFIELQQLNFELDTLIEMEAKDFYNKYRSYHFHNPLKMQLEDVHQKSITNTISNLDKSITKNFQNLLEKTAFLLEYKMHLSRQLSENRCEKMLKHFTTIFLNEFFKHIVNFDEQFSTVFYVFKKENGLIKSDQNNLFAYWDSKFEYSFLHFEKRYHIWNETKFLYYKLHDFVKKRISHKYNIDPNIEYIHSYLLGTQYGDEWTNILDVILPYPEFLNNTIFDNKINENQIRNLLFEVNSSSSVIQIHILENCDVCPIQRLDYCRSSFTQLTLCSYLRPSDYFDLHEFDIDSKLTNRNYTSKLLENKLKIFVLNEALKGFSAFVSVENLLVEPVLFSHVDNYNREMTKRLILALRFLPKFAYYYFVDDWRLALLSNETKFRNDFNEYWHDLRKFFAIILQFQLIKIVNENHQVSLTENFQNYLNKLINNDVSSDYLIDELKIEPFLEYFQPLVNFFENVEDFKEITTKIPEISTNVWKPMVLTTEEIVNESIDNDLIQIPMSKVPNYDNNEHLWILNFSVGLLAFVISFTTCSILFFSLHFVYVKLVKREKLPRNRR